MSQRSILSFVKGGKTVAKSTSAAGRGPAKSAGVKRAASDGTSASDTSPNKRTATGEGEAAAQLSPEQMERMEKNKMQAALKLAEKQGVPSTGSIGPSWRHALRAQFSQPYWLKLMAFLRAQREAGKTIYPPARDVFSFTRACTIQDVRVVILGQDPYHGPNQAHGLCFSVMPGVRVPPSLKNIYKELETDVDGFAAPKHGYLMSWADQGVLLLNAVLTVQHTKANSHANQGWEKFTDAIISWVSSHNDNVVFMLWGSYAQKKGAKVDKSKHCIIKTVHPSPLSAHRGFFGTQQFTRANAYLEEHGKPPVDWSSVCADVDPNAPRP